MSRRILEIFRNSKIPYISKVYKTIVVISLPQNTTDIHTSKKHLKDDISISELSLVFLSAKND